MRVQSLLANFDSLLQTLQRSLANGDSLLAEPLAGESEYRQVAAALAHADWSRDAQTLADWLHQLDEVGAQSADRRSALDALVQSHGRLRDELDRRLDALERFGVARAGLETQLQAKDEQFSQASARAEPGDRKADLQVNGHFV